MSDFGKDVDIPGKDIVYRQDAIDALAEMYCKSDEDGYVWIIRIDAWKKIDALPSAQPEDKCSECDAWNKYKNYGYSQWIPAMKKSPEIGQIVLCSLKTPRYYGQIHVCKYCAADKYHDHPYFDWGHNGFPNVVAWMPLPEPWEGEEEKDECYKP